MRPTAGASAQKISLGAVLSVSKGGHHVTTMHTSYGLYPSQDPMHPIGRFFNGSNESRVGLHAGLTRDIWAVISPNVTPLQSLISQGDVLVSRALIAAQKLPAAQQAKQLDTLYQLRDLLIRELTERFVRASVGGDVPARCLAARHVAVARRDHRGAGWPDRAVADAAGVVGPSPAHPAPG